MLRRVSPVPPPLPPGFTPASHHPSPSPTTSTHHREYPEPPGRLAALVAQKQASPKAIGIFQALIFTPQGHVGWSFRCREALHCLLAVPEPAFLQPSCCFLELSGDSVKLPLFQACLYLTDSGGGLTFSSRALGNRRSLRLSPSRSPFSSAEPLAHY